MNMLIINNPTTEKKRGTMCSVKGAKTQTKTSLAPWSSTKVQNQLEGVLTSEQYNDEVIK